MVKSFFLTTTIGEAHSPLQGSITPSASIISISLLYMCRPTNKAADRLEYPLSPGQWCS